MILLIKIREDLTGKTFGSLIVIKRAEDYTESNGRRYAQWLCRCICGNTVVVKGEKLTRKTGGTKSCGCSKGKIKAKNVNFNELSKAKDCLCEYYGRKCFTSEHGKCPMTKYYCYEYPTVSYMLNKVNTSENSIKLINYLIESAEKVGYVAK